MANEQTWLTSDTHFGHRRICEYSHRPFSSVEEMDETLINNHNSVVKPNDTVLHCGDFAFGSREYRLSILKRLNGRFTFTLGNHDRSLKQHIESEYKIGKSKVLWVGDCKYVTVHNQIMYLSHLAPRTWVGIGRGVYSIFGHSHNNLPPHIVTRNNRTYILKACDVGVDCPFPNPNNPSETRKYFPVNFWTIKSIMDTRDSLAIEEEGSSDLMSDYSI